jgi:hypothetical protein
VIRVSPKELLAEGVLEIGCVGSALFVLTEKKLHLFYKVGMLDRKIDSYGIARAIELLDRGSNVKRIASDIGVTEHTLARQLAEAGYKRPLSTAAYEVRRREIRKSRAKAA